jgi:hypothetical protein
MTNRTGIYIVPTDRWYIERTVWLIAGMVLLGSTLLAELVNPLWILGVTGTGLVSINVAFTGFCPIGNILQLLGFQPMLGSKAPTRTNLYFLQIDKWYLERRIYLTVGVNICIASLLVLAMVDAVHRFRRVRDGVVRRHRLLRSRQHFVVARCRAATQPSDDALGSLCGLHEVVHLPEPRC